MAAKSSKVTKKAKTTKGKRTRKPRRLLPENLNYIPHNDAPTNLDVVSGRGGGSNHHGGNERYWFKVLGLRPTYKKLGNDNDAKTAIAHSIMNFIKETNGRFLQKEAKTKRWFVLPDKIALDKIKQALRDEYIPLFARGGIENATTVDASAPELTFEAPRIKEPHQSERSNSMNSISLGAFLNLPSKDELTSVVPSTVFASSDTFQSLPGLNLGEWLKSYNTNSRDLMMSQPRSSFINHENTRSSINSLSSSTSMGYAPAEAALFNKPFGVEAPRTLPPSDDFAKEILKLPSFKNDVSRGSLSFPLSLHSLHSLELMASVGNQAISSNSQDKGPSTKNPCTVSRTKTSWNELYEKGLASSFTPV